MVIECTTVHDGYGVVVYRIVAVFDSPVGNISIASTVNERGLVPC